MVFSSPVFLFLFLPAVLIAAAGAAAADRLLVARGMVPSGRGQHPVQNLVLLGFSIAFYLYGSGWQLLTMLGSILLSWGSALLIERTRQRTAVLALTIAAQLGVLGWFKYANFVVDQANTVAGWLGAPLLPWQDVVLPIGISFFVFQGISYSIDVYRRECAARRNLLDVALFKALFPQLIAGPIVRYVDVAREIDTRSFPLEGVAGGAVRFVYGLAKKVIVADAMAAVADAAFGLPAHELTAAAATLGAVAYTFQIYFDFSAYSDMAIGLGHIFGFTFSENFHRPLSAVSITDFWRRWHMTLSSWFRDYLYVPLGGSRVRGWRVYRNLWIVFLASGLWHGASWTFVLWGALHGALLTIERLTKTAKPEGLLPLRRLLTFVLVVLTFTVFRADTLSQTLAFYRHIFVPTDWSLPLEVADQLTHKNLVLGALAVASLFLSPRFVTGRWLSAASGTSVNVVRVLVMSVGALLAAGMLASNHFSPFIYFRF